MFPVTSLNFFKGLPNVDETEEKTDEREGSVEALNAKETINREFLVNKYDLNQIASQFSSQTTCYNFLNFLPPISLEEIEILQDLTKDQHENKRWSQLRKGRITASNFYKVFIRVNTVKKDGKENTDCSALLKLLMGYQQVNPNIISLKYGRDTEPIAICAYLNSYRKVHKDVVTSKSGLFIDKENIYLSATPDLMISCSCCGDGLLEVKCPLIPECHKCTNFCSCKLPEYIVFIDGVFNIKQNHAYYVQVQGQLAITGRKWCDLYVYTVNGPLECRIEFQEQNYHEILLPNLKFFFNEYIVPELIDGRLKKQLESVEEQMEVDTCNTDSQASSRFFCPVCNNIIQENENILTYRQNSVACDNCNLWYHLTCAKVKQNEVKSKQWFCTKCRN